MNHKQYGKLFLILGLFFILMYASTEESTGDKKESASEWGRVGFGIFGLAILVIGAIMLFGPGTQPGGFIFIPAGLIIAALAFGGVSGCSLTTGIVGLLTPDATIPVWVWGIAALLLFMMIAKGGKHK